MLALALLAGCVRTEVRQVPVLLPLPARPALTAVPAAGVACLSDATYTDLVNRERALRTWGLQLEAVIEANNAHAQKGR